MTKRFEPMQSPQRQPGLEHEMDPTPDYTPRYAGSDRLADKVALITGGDSGIGRATAVLYAREGAKVAFVYRDEDRDAEKTKELVEDEGTEVLLIRGDEPWPPRMAPSVHRAVDDRQFVKG